MNFGQAFLLLFALAKFVDAGGDETPKLRGLKTTIDKTEYYVNSWEESLGVCNGQNHKKTRITNKKERLSNNTNTRKTKNQVQKLVATSSTQAT